MSSAQHQKLTAVKINGATYDLDEGGDYTGADLKRIGHVPAGETLYL